MKAAPAVRIPEDTRWELLSDRFSPMLVKEVRQALRGRYFTVLFWLTLCLATIASSFFLVFQVGAHPRVTSGPTFFMLLYGCLSVAVHLFVPFSAFLSLGTERDENAYDLLVLSNLRPRQILLGKLLACGMQVLLYYSAFLPFLAFAFLLPGLDLVAAAWVLVLTMASSLFVSVLAMSFGCMVRQRLARSLVMALLVVGLVPVTIFPIVMAQALVSWPTTVSQPGFTIFVVAFLTAMLVLSGQLFAYASARLAHPEENRSTGLRLITTLLMLAGLGWALWAHAQFSGIEPLGTVCLLLIAAAGVFSTTYACEPERLGRRVRLHVPRSRWLALPSLIYLPGGGRGFLFLLAHLALVAGTFFAVLAARGSFEPLAWRHAATDDARVALMVLAACSYVVIYVGLPTALLAPLTASSFWRVLSGVLVPVLLFAGFFVPTLWGFVVGSRDLGNASHLGNPLWILITLAEGRAFRHQGLLGLLLGAALLVLLLNVPRMLRGAREVREALSARRALEERRATQPALGARGEHALPDA